VKSILVVANETAAARSLIVRLQERAQREEITVTVLAPVNQPREGYVVYEDTRRAAAGRRLEKTVGDLRRAGIPAHGLVVDADPPDAVRDALATMEPRPDEIVLSTHPLQKSGWLRRNVLDRVRSAAGDVPVEHVVVEEARDDSEQNVLVIANETVLGEPLLQKIRERAGKGAASFLIISPQSDPDQGEHPEAERRLRAALAKLRSEGIEAHGQVAHPDPFTAAMHAVRDERIDEIIASTFPEEKGSTWLKGDLVGKLRRETKLPVEHVVVQPGEREVTA
jgi:hypothetical protein